MKHASLCSGVGGFDLAAAWMGWDNVFQVEKDPFCNKVLSGHFPNVKRYSDVRQFNALPYANTIDIISAGFPCQPFSLAGSRKGETDDRFLWPETIRVIRELHTRWIVLENVAGLLSILESESLSSVEIQTIELFSQDQDQQAGKTILRLQRRIIGRIISEIAAAGYLLPTLSDGTPVVLCIPAVAVGAPHRRDRIWIVAHTTGNGIRLDPATFIPDEKWHHQGKKERRKQQPGGAGSAGPGRHAAYTQSAGLEGWPQTRNLDSQGQIPEQYPPRLFKYVDWSNWPTQSPVCRGADGIPSYLDGISIPAWRKESIKAFGNAIVPQVAFELFKIISIVETQIFQAA